MLTEKAIPTAPENPVQKPVLEVRNLTTVFDTSEGTAMAVQNVNFVLYEGETLGIVGESGCGKTVTALSILRLIRKPGRIDSGEIYFNGRRLDTLSEKEIRTIRGNQISLVFQEPMTSLNPVFHIGSQITEVLLKHKVTSKTEARSLALERLSDVGIPDPERVFNAYPHQLSGGMRQRVLIAMSLACTPQILIADEPTTAIDVSVQAQILRLLDDLKKEFGMAVVIISHDLGVVAEICDRILIMYASHIVEEGNAEDIFYRPRHPYTCGLLQSLPAFHAVKQHLNILPGQVPRPTHYPPGCNFSSRCNFASDYCIIHEPVLETIESGHRVACWHWQQVQFTI